MHINKSQLKKISEEKIVLMFYGSDITIWVSGQLGKN